MNFFEQFNVKNLLALTIIAGSLAIVAALINNAVPEGNKDLFNILAALWFRETTSPIVKYFFPTKEQTPEKGNAKP